MKSPLKLLKGKIRAKIFASVLFILLISIAITALFSNSLLFRVFTSKTYHQLCSVADTIDTLIPDSGTYYIDLYSLAENHNIEFEIVDTEGFLLYTTQGYGTPLSSSHFGSASNNRAAYDEMQATMTGAKTFGYDNFEVKKKLATNAEYFIYTYDLSTGDILHIFSPVADVEGVVDIAAGVYSVYNILLVIIIGVLFLTIATRFTKPVEAMNKVTKNMAALDFSKKCDNYGEDEIGELGKSINTLSNTLDSTLVDLKDKNEQLEKDIELRLALDNARKSFISNVSHELKTPIAIISGYAEGLYEGISDDPQVIKEYCGIINQESQRMNELVLELLELSRLESKSSPFNPDYYDIGENVAKLLSHLSLQISQNEITVDNQVPLSLECFAQGDKIEIVLKNYITNAISHCSGDKKITITSEDMGETIKITVFNTGTPIDGADMPEIWDSFYRADKAHGRSENRFGLGLSIVKSIMNNHNCHFGAENTEDGVKFSFEVAKGPEYYENK